MTRREGFTTTAGDRLRIAKTAVVEPDKAVAYTSLTSNLERCVSIQVA